MTKHPCAVCPKPINLGFLMCGAHWKLVPKNQQDAVYRTWGAYQRTNVRSGYGVNVRHEYFKARDLAIATVRAALEPTTTGEMNGQEPA